MSGFNWSFCLCHCNAPCSQEKITAVPYSETHTFAIVCTFVGQDYTVPQLVSTALALEPCILLVTSVCWETTFGGPEKKSKQSQQSIKSSFMHCEMITRLHALFKLVDI